MLNRDFDIARQPGIHVVEVEPIDLTIDLEGDVPARCRLDHGFDVERVRLALEDQTPGRVGEHVNPRTGQRSKQTIGHSLGIEAECGVDRRDHDIEL